MPNHFQIVDEKRSFIEEKQIGATIPHFTSSLRTQITFMKLLLTLFVHLHFFLFLVKILLDFYAMKMAMHSNMLP